MNGRTQIIIGLILAALGAALIVTDAAFSLETLAPFLGAPFRYGLLIAGGLYAILGVLTALVAAISGGERGARRREEEARRRGLDAFHEILTGATVRMVGADGRISDAEMSMVQSVIGKFGQSPVDGGTIRSVAEAAHGDPERYVNLIRERGDAMSQEQKTQILRACLLVAMSDVMLDPAELEYLRLVAEALELPEDAIASVRQELENVAQKLVGAAVHVA